MLDQIRTTDALQILIRLAHRTLEERAKSSPDMRQDATEDMLIKHAVEHAEKMVLCIKDSSSILKSISVVESVPCD